MKPILQQMYDYHYGSSFAHDNANRRIKELEKTARLVLENGCLLTVAELAEVFIRSDCDKECPFCTKDEWGEWEEDGTGEHGHDASCPFAIAYQVLTPDLSGAMELR